MLKPLLFIFLQAEMRNGGIKMANGFSCFNEFLNNVAYNIDNWKTYGRKESGTGDDYKLELRERTQFFYTIEDMTKIITDYKTLQQYPFWACGELISEIFAQNPPLMHKYKPEIIEQAYKLRDDHSCEYLYGRRFSEFNEIGNTISILSKRLDSKRAIIPIFTPYDTDPNRNDVPCTLGYSIKIRDGKLNTTVFFRSHDLMQGVKYDVLLTSFISQIIAMGINANTKENIIPGKLGIYEDSLHVYPRKDKEKYEKFKKEAHSEDVNERFNIMHSYKTVAEIYDDLWYVVKAEESSYYSNFEFALEKINKIENPAFKDMAKCFYNRNLKFLKKENLYKELKYDTNILRWTNSDKK